MCVVCVCGVYVCVVCVCVVCVCVCVVCMCAWCVEGVCSLVPRPHPKIGKGPDSTSVLNLSLLYTSSNACYGRTRLISDQLTIAVAKTNVEPERALFHSISVDRDSSQC